jgi:hypothetical protein
MKKQVNKLIYTLLSEVKNLFHTTSLEHKFDHKHVTDVM